MIIKNQAQRSGSGQMESWTIERDGLPLDGLWRPGRGAAVVVVPGAMADASDFVAVAEAMGHDGPILVVDRRGRGRSAPQGREYDLATEVADLRAWLDHLHAPVTVVGWSLGGTISLEVAAQDDRVASVIAYDPVLPPFVAEVVPRLARASLDERVVIVNRDVTGLSEEEVAALRAGVAWPHLTELAAPVAAELAALNRFEPHPGWAGLAAELIVGGRSQHTEPYGPAFERVAARIPSARITVLPGQGHLAHVENPRLLGATIGAALPGRG